MAWVRRVRTASGATAVQIAESVAGRRRIVRHVGSARDEGELGLLIAEANRLLAQDAQHELDLGLTPVALKAVMIPAPSQGLFPGATKSVGGCAGPCAQDLLRVAVRGLGRGVRRVGLRRGRRRGLRDLVIAGSWSRPACWTSIGSWLSWPGPRRACRRANGPYDAPAPAATGDILAAACFTMPPPRDVTLVLYDDHVQTSRPTSRTSCQGRLVKERRVDPQIVVGLLVDWRGFPLEVGCFEGK